VGGLLTVCSVDAVLHSLKSLGPAAVELELSLLSSPADDSADDDDLLVAFIELITYLFTAKRDVDLASSYLGLLIKVSSQGHCVDFTFKVNSYIFTFKVS